AVLAVEPGPPAAVAVATESLDDERVVGGHARLVEDVVQQLVVAGLRHPEPLADRLGLRAREGTPDPLEVDDVAAPLRELHQDSDPRLKVRPGQRPPRVATAPPYRAPSPAEQNPTIRTGTECRISFLERRSDGAGAPTLACPGALSGLDRVAKYRPNLFIDIRNSSI